jgi:hypothetical protein
MIGSRPFMLVRPIRLDVVAEPWQNPSGDGATHFYQV